MTAPSSLIFKQLKIGPMNNFIYLIGDKESRQVGIIDPSWDIARLEREAATFLATITCVLLTHGHPDHINGVDELLAKYPDLKIYISKDEAEYYVPQWKNLSLLTDQDKIKIGQIVIECLATPGHSPGGICFKYDDILLSGDTLFVDAIGRCDLPGGDPKSMYETLYHKIMLLPDSTIIYPGHAYGSSSSTTLGSQKKSNPYLQCRNLNAFLAMVLG